MGELMYLNPAVNASYDPDLVAFYELKIYGQTEAVPETRADILADYSQERLHAEVQRDYGLDGHNLRVAVKQCLGRICEDVCNVE